MVIVSFFPLFVSYKIPHVFAEPGLNMTEDAPVITTMHYYVITNQTVPVNQLVGIQAFWFYAVSNALSTFSVILRQLPPMLIVATICDMAVDSGAIATVLSILNGASGLRGLIESRIIEEFGITRYNFKNVPSMSTLVILFQVVILVCSCCFIPKRSVKQQIQGDETVIEPQ